jgi:isocitrate/isopropylmalate dehydrogenase
MLDHIGERDAAARVRRAIDEVLSTTDVRTRDLGGTASTSDYAAALCAALA